MPSTQMRDVKDIKDLVLEQSMDVNVPRSEVNLSRRKFMNGDIGMIHIVDMFPVQPRDSLNVSFDWIIDTEALQVVPFTRYKVRVHYYYSDLDSLWKGAQTFVTKGRTGQISLKVPHWKNKGVDTYKDYDGFVSTDGSKSLTPFAPMGLNAQLKIPAPYYQGASKTANQLDSYLPICRIDGTKGTDYQETGYKMPSVLNLLPYMMYQKIFRFNYLPNNLLQGNKVWFPEDLADEWRISYSGDNVSCCLDDNDSSYNGMPFFVPSSTKLPGKDEYITRIIPSADSTNPDNAINLFDIRYCMYGNDIFTTALPWLTRGSEPSVDTTITAVDEFVKAQFLNSSDNTYYGGIHSYSAGIPGLSQSEQVEILNPNGYLGINKAQSGAFSANGSSDNSTNYDGYLGVKFSGIPAKSTLTANQLRNLLALSVFQERNALTNGDYNTFIRAHYGSTPKQKDYEPKYIGGTSGFIDFNTIIQTSESNKTPQGRQTGLGHISGSSYIGHLETDDFGYLIGVMMITPEVTYVQGQEHWMFDLTAEDLYFPERANLSFQPILNKQLFTAGDETDDQLFGYSTRYAYLKQRNDEVCGLFALPPDKTGDLLFSAYAQCRIFTSCPKLSYQFLCVSPFNIRRDFMFAPSQPLFRIQSASNIKGSRAVPWKNTPNTFGF